MAEVNRGPMGGEPSVVHCDPNALNNSGTDMNGAEDICNFRTVPRGMDDAETRSVLDVTSTQALEIIEGYQNCVLDLELESVGVCEYSNSNFCQDDQYSEENLSNYYGQNWLIFLMFLGVATSYADRSNISNAIIAMDSEYGFSSHQKNSILAAFYLGYLLTHVFGGIMADFFGGKLVLLIAVIVWSAMTALSPTMADLGVLPLVAGRSILGLGEGVAIPACHSLISASCSNRCCVATATVTAGTYFGAALAFGVTPLVVERMSWRWSFWIFAAAGFVWLPFWIWYDANTLQFSAWPSLQSPSSKAVHNSGREKEKQDSTDASEEYSCIVSLPFCRGQSSKKIVLCGSLVPFYTVARLCFRLVRRKEIIGIIICQYCSGFGIYGLLAWLPTFIHEEFDANDCVLSLSVMIPYIVQGIVAFASGPISTILEEPKDETSIRWYHMRVKRVRQTLQGISMVVPGTFLLLVSRSQSILVASIYLTIGCGFSSLSCAAVSVSQHDVAPRFAGLAFGLGNTSSTLAGIIAVPLLGNIHSATGSWSGVFITASCHYFLGCIFWILLVGDEPVDTDLLMH